MSEQQTPTELERLQAVVQTIANEQSRIQSDSWQSPTSRRLYRQRKSEWDTLAKKVGTLAEAAKLAHGGNSESADMLLDSAASIQPSPPDEADDGYQGWLSTLEPMERVRVEIEQAKQRAKRRQ